VLSVLRFTDSDYPFGIFKLFFKKNPTYIPYHFMSLDSMIWIRKIIDKGREEAIP
jgi:hypothetical protein